jgi:hypothetical protein
MNCYASFPMRRSHKSLGLLVFMSAVGLAACGGSLGQDDAGGGAGGSSQGGAGGSSGGTTGSGGSTTGPCASLNGCECLAASDRCTARSEACWCPTECYPGAPIECVCGGGQFLACEDTNVVTACSNELAAVQTKCAGQAFVQYIGALCGQTRADPHCIATCLANLNATGSCSEIDCGFCTVCDCAQPATPSPFAQCLAACNTPPLPL